MKNKQLRSLLSGGMAAAVLAAGLVLPQGAKAEAAPSTGIDCNQPVQQTQKVWVKWNWNGSFDDLKKLLDQLPTTGWQPVTPEQPEQETPAPPSEQPATPSKPSEKPTAPSEKPTNGSESDNNNGTPATPSKPTAPSDNNNNTNGQNDAASFASQVVDLVNQERSKTGLKPLTTQANLTKVAAAKAADMRQNNYFDHQSPTYGSPFDMMKQFGVSYSYAGENIAKGQRTPAEVMNAWMNSDGHRKNILNANFTTIGVAYDNGYWVQEFIGN